MADVNTSVVIKVEAQASEAIASIVKLKAETEDLKNRQSQLDTSTDDGKKKFEAYSATIKANNAEIRSLSTATQNMAKEQQAAAGSIDQMRAQVNSLTKEFTKLSQAERDSAKGQELKASIKTKTDELKALEKSIGDNRRNVGNYADSIKEAASGMSLFGRNIGDVGGSISGITDGFKAAGGGVKGFGMALATLGLPLLIAAMQTLMGIFERFKPLMDAIEQATAALGAAFNALIHGGSMTEAASQAAALTAALQDLEDAEMSLQIQQAKTETSVKRLIIASKDRTKTEEQRISLLKAAAQMEEANFQRQQQHAKADLETRKEIFRNKYNLTKQEMDIVMNAQSDEEIERKRVILDKTTETKEEIDMLRDKHIKIIQMEGQSLELREKIQNRENALVQEIEDDKQKAIEKTKAEREKAAAKALQLAEKEKQAELKKAKDILDATVLMNQLRVEAMESSREKEIQAVKASSYAKLMQLKLEGKTSLEIIELETKAAANKIAEINKKFDTEDLQREKERQAKLKEAKEKALENELSLIRARRAEEELAKGSTLQSDIDLLTKKLEYDLQSTELSYEKKLELEANYNRDAARLREADAKNAETLARQKASAEMYYIDALVSGLQLAAQAMGQNTVEGKALLVAQTLFSTYSAAQKAFESQLVPADPTSTVRAFIAASLATVGGLARVASIASTPVQTFAKGGIIGGKPHSEGGTKFYGTDGSIFEAERGELLTVVNKHDTATISGLSAINSRHGKPFSGAKTFLESGGFAATSMTSDFSGIERLAKMASKQGQPIVRVSEINSVQTRVSVRESNAI